MRAVATWLSSEIAAQRAIAFSGTVQGAGWWSITGGSSARAGTGRTSRPRHSTIPIFIAFAPRLLPAHVVTIRLAAQGGDRRLHLPGARVLLPDLPRDREQGRSLLGRDVRGGRGDRSLELAAVDGGGDGQAPYLDRSVALVHEHDVHRVPLPRLHGLGAHLEAQPARQLGRLRPLLDRDPGRILEAVGDGPRAALGAGGLGLAGNEDTAGGP